jgi:hypothetical protein
VLFGPKCPHLISVLAIRDGLEHSLELKLTKLLCLHLLWRIHFDAHQFFTACERWSSGAPLPLSALATRYHSWSTTVTLWSPKYAQSHTSWDQPSQARDQRWQREPGQGTAPSLPQTHPSHLSAGLWSTNSTHCTRLCPLPPSQRKGGYNHKTFSWNEKGTVLALGFLADAPPGASTTMWYEQSRPSGREQSMPSSSPRWPH